MSEKPLVKVEHVSKKFCRNLRRSLWYGLKDLGGELTAQNGEGRLQLRPDEFLAVDDVSFELHRGECLGLVGANGAGKSTLLKMLNGLVRPDAGRITVCGRVGALIELGAGFNPILTGRENVYINGAVLGLSKKEIDARFDEIVDFAELGEFIDTPVQSYSSGMRVRLGMAVAVNLNPEVLLVDEVLAVGDVGFRMKCFQYFMDLKKIGRTVVVVSHSMIDVNRVCDRVVVIEEGRKTHDGDVSTGIATYESHLLQKDRSVSKRTSDTAAWIDKVELFAAQGERRGEFQTGDDLVVEVTLAAIKRVANARLIVHVTTPSLGVLGSFSSPHRDFKYDIVPPATVVRFSIRSLPLLVGSYSLRLSLYGPDVKDFLDTATMSPQFKVVGPPVDTFGYGVCHTVLFDHEWALAKE